MRQLINIGWDIENKRYKQIFTFRDLDTNEIKRFDLSNYNFNFKFSDNKYCTGYHSKDETFICPYNNKINRSNSQCNYCESKQGFKSAFIFGRDPNENVKEYLSQPHYIYLAYFPNDIIKVGTASLSRKHKRLIEQDALIYAFIAENDGLNITKLEHKISKDLNITEFVKSGIKLKMLSMKPDFKRGSRLIIDQYNRIRDKLINSEFKDWIYKSEEIKVYDNSEIEEIFYPSNSINVIKDINILSGQFKGIRGNYIIIVNNNDLFVFDYRYLIGRTIEDLLEQYKYRIQNEQLNLFN